MKKEIKLFQGIDFKLVGARDMDPREVLPGAVGDSSTRTSEEDPSIGDIARVSDEAASVVYIEGYASVFLNPDGSRLEDRDGESVSIALLDIDNYKKNPILVYNHDWSDVMGKIVAVEKDAKGLYVKAEVHKLTGRESVFESVQKGLVTTFSIGFVPKKFTYLEDEDIFEISSAELVEISLAPVPANQDSLFIATSQKSMRLDKQMVKDQTKMTCDELSGVCTVKKSIKGKDMSIETKEVEGTEAIEDKNLETPAPEAKETPAEPKKDPIVEPKKDDAMTVDNLAEAISAANEAAEVKKAQKAADEEAEAAAVAKAEEDAIKKRVEDSFNYIKERKEAIASTPAGEIDTEELSEFYELLSDTVDLINDKVIEAVSAVA